MGNRSRAGLLQGRGKRPVRRHHADDFYGRTAFSEIYDFLAAQTDESCYADSNEMQA